MSFLEIVLILFSFWIMCVGIYELFAGVVFWENFLRINISENGKVIIARILGLVFAILGGILIFSYRSKVGWGGGIGIFFLLGSFVMLLQSIFVIVFGERGMSKKIAEFIEDFREFTYIGKDTYDEMPARVWGLVILIIFIIVFICVYSGMASYPSK